MEAFKGKGKRKASEIVFEEEDYDYEEEVWKHCHLSPLYEVSNRGRVRRTENKFIRKNAINPHGYQYLTLPIDGKDYTSLVGRLVLHAFVGDPGDDQVAHHIDGNPSNDHIGNLRWTSIAEAGIKRVYPSAISSRHVIAENVDGGDAHLFISALEASNFIGSTRSAVYDSIRFDRELLGYKFDYDVSDEPTCEKRKVIGWDCYMVSKDGKIKGTLGGWRLGTRHGVNSGSDERVYRRTDLTRYIDGKKDCKHKYVHVLVAEAFLGECPAGYQIDHIDGDTSHNDVSNLQYVSRSENNKRAYKNGKKPPGQKWVVLIRPDGTFTRYRSLSEGARQTGVAVATVSLSSSMKRKTQDGEYWARDRPVTRHNFVDGTTEEFKSLSVASEETGGNIFAIMMACRDEEDPNWTIED